MKMTVTKKNLICISLCSFLLLLGFGSAVAQDTPNNTNNSATQLDAQTQKVKNQIEKIGQGKDITIVTKNGKTFYGSVAIIEADFVLFSDVDRNNVAEIKYQDIKKVRKSYGINRDLNGNRIPPKKNLIGLLIGTAAIAIPIIIVIVSLK